MGDALLAPETGPSGFLVLNILMITPLVFGLVIYLADRQKRANEALAEANVTISKLVHSLEAQVARAQDAEQHALEASRAKSRFLANMSHELRTPLNAIIGYSELLSGEKLKPRQQHDVSRITHSGRHLLDLINGVLDLAKVESGRMDVTWEVVDLHAVVDSAVEIVGPQLAASGNRVTVDVAPALHSVVLDSRKVEQILLNLLSNAGKFTQDGEIRLGVRPLEESVVLEVADTGIGMTSEAAARVFEPFRQADASTTRRYGGTGLGLPLVEKLAELMGGTASLCSVEGVGTTVTVVLRGPALAK